MGRDFTLGLAWSGDTVVNGSAPNPLQPLVDMAISGCSKLAACLVLGCMVYIVIMFAFRLALRGRPSTKSSRQFSDLLARAAGGLSMFYLFYLAFVVIEPVRPGSPQAVQHREAQALAGRSRRRRHADLGRDGFGVVFYRCLRSTIPTISRGAINPAPRTCLPRLRKLSGNDRCSSRRLRHGDT